MIEQKKSGVDPQDKAWYTKPIAIISLFSAFIAGVAGFITNSKTIMDFFRNNTDLSVTMSMQRLSHDRAHLFVAFHVDNNLAVSATQCFILGWNGIEIDSKFGSENFTIPANAKDYVIGTTFVASSFGFDFSKQIKTQISCKDHSSNTLDIEIKSIS